MTRSESAADLETRAPSSPWRVGLSLFWLAYLAIYFLPWLARPPSPTEVMASVAGTALFLGLWFHQFLAKPRSTLPHILVIAAIGFALSPFGGAWSVFNVYAASVAGRLQPQRRALWLIALLQLSLIAYAIAFPHDWPAWVSGLFFGVLAAGATLLQSDLEARNARLVAMQEEVRTLSALAERERIARDLHDLLGHTLTLVAIKAELATRLIDRDAAAARREMQEVAQSARDTLAEVRAAVSGMHGASFAVELARGRQMLAAANVEAEVRADLGPVDPPRDAVLAMALREAVTNVIRHAAASHCVISLEADPRGDLKLTVADDGRGGALALGRGLEGMKARLAAAGGALDIDSDQRGTRLIAHLPRLAA